MCRHSRLGHQLRDWVERELDWAGMAEQESYWLARMFRGGVGEQEQLDLLEVMESGGVGQVVQVGQVVGEG